MAVNNMESGDPSIVVSWRTAEFAAEKAPFGVEDVPQWLKPDSLQGIYVRAEARTLQGVKGVPFRAFPSGRKGCSLQKHELFRKL